MDRLEVGRATFERNIEKQTGRSVAGWAVLVSQQGFTRHGQMVAWLKAQHALAHSHANHIAKQVLSDAAPRSSDDPVAHLFEGGKESLRPLYDQLTAAALALGDDVEIAPKKANVSLRRRKQFALIQPTTRTRLDLGLILKDRAPHGRLEPSGSFHAMFTHRIRMASASDLDADLLGWLKAAYDDAV
jgi:hypothetical protein